ncbi:class I SAM-dependent methyltransferase [Streptomyces sp. NPDC059740]|uniref:class I SAM-dependent methyltransferase n=1 Tax=Streptomyces sp. NPDC059740 TaxID=3346926 RepID=UPI00365D0E0D
MTELPRARSFDSAAAQYAANRPSYPPALFDAVEELARLPLAGARVADVGAGTGIATALLDRRGAQVVAVEPGDGMAAQFHSDHPDLPIVRGDGNALPLADASQDLVTYAQSWHWIEPARAVPEARRVLRPGGALAVWWNTTAVEVPWLTAQNERIAEHFGVRRPQRKRPRGDRAIRLAGLADAEGLQAERRQTRWSRVVPLDTHLANIATQSAFLVQGEAASRAFLAAERDCLLALFPDGLVEESYLVDLLVARSW